MRQLSFPGRSGGHTNHRLAHDCRILHQKVIAKCEARRHVGGNGDHDVRTRALYYPQADTRSLMKGSTHGHSRVRPDLFLCRSIT